MKCDQDFEFDGVEPLKGPKGDTAFLRSNYKFMAPGGSFRTVKARFSPAQIQAGAKQACWVVDIREEGPWLKVTATKRLPPEKVATGPARRAVGSVAKQPEFYVGAGKTYSKVRRSPQPYPTAGIERKRKNEALQVDRRA
jgi:hypothetical protein